LTCDEQRRAVDCIMKYILAIVATLAAAEPAMAQIDKSPWYGVPTTPVQAPALKPISLPPPEFDHEYKGQMIVTKWNDYSLIRLICKDIPTAIACSYRVHNSVTGKDISCLIMLGPMVHDDKRALQHEIGHCNGWGSDHAGAR
jgi:hypothetical protein